MRTTTTFTATIEHTEEPTKPPTQRWEVWLQEPDGDVYRLLQDKHVRRTADEIAARPLRSGFGRLVVHRVA
jgi:hypothetical protein